MNLVNVFVNFRMVHPTVCPIEISIVHDDEQENTCDKIENTMLVNISVKVSCNAVLCSQEKHDNSVNGKNDNRAKRVFHFGEQLRLFWKTLLNF